MSTTITSSELDLAYFRYIPNRPACYVAIGVFSILFILLSIRALTMGCRPYVYLLPLTAAAEVVGFVLRHICSDNPTTEVFTTMSILLLISANIMALVNYKAVGDVIRLSGVETRFNIIGPKFTNTFYKTNLLATILQAVGGGLQTSGSAHSSGSALTIVGFSIQLVFFAIFLISVHYVNTCPDYRLYHNNQNHKSDIMRVMYIIMALLFVRSTYRLASYIIASNHIGQTHEWTFYVFDALLIALCFLIHFIWFIGHYIPRDILHDEGKGPDDVYYVSRNDV